jgi:hypothetical protein
MKTLNSTKHFVEREVVLEIKWGRKGYCPLQGQPTDSNNQGFWRSGHPATCFLTRQSIPETFPSEPGDPGLRVHGLSESGSDQPVCASILTAKRR